jgi:hypothetical protein
VHAAAAPESSLHVVVTPVPLVVNEIWAEVDDVEPLGADVMVTVGPAPSTFHDTDAVPGGFVPSDTLSVKVWPPTASPAFVHEPLTLATLVGAVQAGDAGAPSSVHVSVGAVPPGAGLVIV